MHEYKDRCWICKAVESQPPKAESKHCVVLEHPHTRQLIATPKEHLAAPGAVVLQEAVDLIIKQSKPGMFSDAEKCVGHWCLTVIPTSNVGKSHAHAE